MKNFAILFLLLFVCATASAQSDLQKLYDTEKAFERAAAEKGVNQAFVEYSAPDGVCFNPSPVNCREYWRGRPASPAALLWNPNFVDVSSNGAMGYTTGNSIYRAKGKDDPEAYYGQYVTVWQRQPNGTYLAAIDLGITHEKTAADTEWKSPADSGRELNEKKSSAADASTAFFETATKQGLGRAYKTFLAEDARLLREGKQPILGKPNALAGFKNDKTRVFFAKRSVFVGAADMAYVSNTYTVSDRSGKQIEKGNFLQIWKLRAGKWQIVLDAFLPIPEPKN
ncbi:MAG TPA: nuclear transport factor 2 family protein [Pyrinomonadaceae bacterium]|nr:nuclear transport factor 2 family protein [Pyrinomonadaceae bacterium]